MWQLLSVLRIVLLICVIWSTESCYDFVEKGETTGFQCTFSINPTMITYQLVTGNKALNLTTCNMVSRMCTDHQPSVYQGRVLSSVQGNYTMQLTVKSARINETRFRCLTGSGFVSNVCGLEVYVWPTRPVCEPMRLDNKNLSLELTCTSSNVYPAFLAEIHWSPGVALEIDRNNHVCTVSYLGYGSLGDVSETCTWHFPVSKMPADVYYFYITVSPLITNSTAVTKSAVSSPLVTADLRLPRPIIYGTECPVGLGVVGDYIKVGTSATCKCDLDQVGLWDGQAQWFTADGRNVGVENRNDGSSTLTLSYNSSDPDVTYKCRASNPTSKELITTYKPMFPSPGCHGIVEKGKRTQLECPVIGSVHTIAWQVWTGEQYVQVSTCTLTGTCVDHMSQVYKGYFVYSSGVLMFKLDISSVTANETQFRCLTDNGNVVKICTLEPYRWPSIVTYRGMQIINQFVEVTFSSVVYPNVQASLHRRNTVLSKGDIESGNCSLNASTTDPNSDYMATCTWRIRLSKMLPSNTFYAEMSVRVTNSALVNRSPVVSNDTLIQLVTVSLNNCPAGPGVTGKEIRKGTAATCTCTASSNGFFNTVQARWFTADGKVVGMEDSSNGSSTLTVSFNSSDPSPTYECRGVNPTREYPSTTYQPKFFSPGCHVIVEKGQSTQLECPIQSSINALSWQVWSRDQYVQVTTCHLLGTCVDHMSQAYKGHVLYSLRAATQLFTLDISSVRSNETQFRCLTDQGNVDKICTLETYRWPGIPTYEGMRIINQSVEVTYSTVVYPNIDASLHRRNTFLSNDDVDSSYCSLNTSSTDPNSDYIATCTWRIPIAKMLLSNTFYVEMSTRVTNQSLVNRSPVVSNDTLIQLVTVSLNNCPAGPGVKGEEIRKGTSATCTCIASSNGFFNTVQARWFTTHEEVVGVEDSSAGSSTLTVSFSPSDPSPTYECRGLNPTREYPSTTYQPQFFSSSHGCSITWTLFLLVVCAGLSSTLY